MLFNETVGKATEFDLNDVTSLWEAGMRDQAEVLFNETVGLATEFNSDDVLSLSEAGMRDQAKELFNETVGKATEFNSDDVLSLSEAGMRDQALQVLVDIKYRKASPSEMNERFGSRKHNLLTKWWYSK